MAGIPGIGRWFAGGAGIALALVVGACTTTAGFRGDAEFGAFRVLSDVDVIPKLASVPDVAYPEIQLAQGIEGTAELTYVVDTTGATEDIKVVAASDPAFGDAAERAVRRLQYVPARKGLQSVRCAVALTFIFKIH